MKSPVSLILLLLASTPTLRAETPIAVIEEKFRAFDTDGDGLIRGAELEAATYLPKLDIDRNGALTLAEAIEALNGKPAVKPAASGSDLFNQLDSNGDGQLTVNELPKKRWFTALDQDNSGGVTFEEAQSAFARLRRSGEILPSAGAVKPASEDPALKEAPLVLKGSDHGIGRLVPDLTFKDLSGNEHRLSATLKESQGAVIAFFGATCPISGKLGPELARLEKDAAKQNLRFLLVCPTAAETADDLSRFSATHGLQSLVIHDQDGRITATLGATTTTEVFLADAKRTLIYRGAINDQYGLGYAKDQPTRTYLRDAATAMLAGELPEISATTSPGCAIDLPKVAAAPAASPVTYHNQISRILQTNCIECHRSDGLGPFSLESYDDVIENAGMIRKQVERGVMPPWFAAPVAGQKHTPWLNDTSLSTEDKAALLTWLASDRPKGDAADSPQPLKFPKDWALGEPDAVVQLPKPISIKAEGTMPYQFVTVATDFPEDRWVQAYEILPTDRAVVHHVIVQVHQKGESARDRGEGAGGYWAAYVPGNSTHAYPAGFAKKLPAGATVSFQIHYTPNGKRSEDQLKMGLHFAKEPPRYIVHTAAVAQTKLNIPAGAADHVETAERTLPTDMNLTAYMAHMHVRGKAFTFEATFPDGKHQLLLDIPRYDFNWQLRYDYALPKFLPKGTKVKITAIFDNSEANPANPDPTKTVRWGQQTYDEMMIGYFEYYTPFSSDVAAQ